MSNNVDQTMSLTPPGKLHVNARVGGAIIGLGLLAAYSILLSSAPLASNLGLMLAAAPMVIAGILATRKKPQEKTMVAILSVAGIMGLVFFFLDFSTPSWLAFILVYIFPAVGAIVYYAYTFGRGPAGIKNNGVFHSQATKNNGVIAWVLAIVFTGFYVLLYWFPQNLYGLIAASDPLVHLLTGSHPVDFETQTVITPWMTYTMIYSFLVVVMGIRFVFKYRHNRYQLIRTGSVTFFQLTLAFILPAFLAKMSGDGSPFFEHYFSYFWPLGYNNLTPDFLAKWDGPGFSKFVVAWSVVMSFIAVPALTYFFGKRWYCSWVCGCGGLAETAGDSFRHLSDKSLKAWRIERVLIYSVLLLITLITAFLFIDARYELVDPHIAKSMKSAYGFVIGSIFAGVVGTGFYPLLGSRAWCRFGCPQAAILGILQKYFSRFRITTNGGQCISCGNCSTHCEMGIDVKAYAQRGQNIVRASCVGCGVCSAVCPRGVLNLENGPSEGRINDLNPLSISPEEINVNL